MRSVQRLAHSVKNWLTLEFGSSAARRTAHVDRNLRVVSGAFGIAQIDLVRQGDERESVRFGNRLVIVYVVQLAGREQRGELGGVRPNVPCRRGREQRFRQAGPSIEAFC